MSDAELFRRTFSREPARLFSAPGRIILIGEHTDYTGGLVLPFAIDARATLAAGASREGLVRVTSAHKSGEVISVALQGLQPGTSPRHRGHPKLGRLPGGCGVGPAGCRLSDRRLRSRTGFAGARRCRAVVIGGRGVRNDVGGGRWRCQRCPGWLWARRRSPSAQRTTSSAFPADRWIRPHPPRAAVRHAGRHDRTHSFRAGRPRSCAADR